MEQTNKTETEQLYNDMTGKADEEQPEEAEEKDEQADEQAQDGEEILSEEQLEIQREIESYQSKIEQLDAKLAELEAKKVDDDKRELMRKWCYTDEQINRYIGYIDGMTSEEIEQSIAKLAEDIAPAGDNFADPSPFNGRAAKPKTVDHTEIGKHAFDRIKHKIFPWMR